MSVSADSEDHKENLPKFHYEVHHVMHKFGARTGDVTDPRDVAHHVTYDVTDHVVHKFGARTPAEVKLRDVARHAAASPSSDDDDDDDDNVPAAVPAGHVTSGDTQRLVNEPVLAEKKPEVDDEQSERVKVDLRDYYEDFNGDDQLADDDDGGSRTLARVAGRSSSNSSPSAVSDVYFVGRPN